MRLWMANADELVCRDIWSTELAVCGSS